MTADHRLIFAGVITDQQTFLDGTREFALAAATEDGSNWQLTLTFRWPKDAAGGPDEGDLTLVDASGGELFATLATGVARESTDDDLGADLIRIDLSFTVASAEGTLAGSPGAVRVTGTLIGDDAHLTIGC